MAISRVLAVQNIKKVWPIVLGIVVAVLVGYYISRGWKEVPEFFQKMPASLEQMKEKEERQEEKLKLEELPEEVKELGLKTGKYREVAGKGEGLTHLARRTLKKYLKDHPQDFTVTPEHKIYIEDYIAKNLGGRWLRVGEEVEISEELIKEAINKAKNLSAVQLQNLSQYVQLVPTLAS